MRTLNKQAAEFTTYFYGHVTNVNDHAGLLVTFQPATIHINAKC